MEHERELAEALLGDEQGRREVTETLLEITSRAAANADGDVGVGLSVLVAGQVESIGATSDPAQQMDHGQADDGDGPCLHALSTGDTVSVPDYTSDERWPRTSQRAAAAGIRSSLSLPLKAEQHVLGALNIYSNAPNAFTSAASVSLEAFAQQATTSLLLLGRLQAQRADSAYVSAFSRTVQDSLRPQLPEVPGVELAGRSVPSSPHAVVGGDWYDAFVLPDGSLGLVIGDVMGHGVEAVTAMSQVRTMIRTAAASGLDPVEVLRVCDQLAHRSGITETVTLVYAALSRDVMGTWLLRYCNAGHPVPLLRQRDGSVDHLSDGTRILLGAMGTGEGVDDAGVGVAELAAGSVLLFYTDGLIERPGEDPEHAASTLARAFGGIDSSSSLAGICDQLLGTPSLSDDTTVFAVRITKQ